MLGLLKEEFLQLVSSELPRLCVAIQSDLALRVDVKLKHPDFLGEGQLKLVHVILRS